MQVTPNKNQQLKSYKQRINQLTNKTVTNVANLGYHQFLTIEVFSNQPIDVLQQTLQSLFNTLPSAQFIYKNKLISGTPKSINQQNLNQSISNQENILLAIQKFVHISQALSQLSHKIYEKQYPLSLYKKFRKLYQQINTTSNILHQYQFNSDFLMDKKEQLINQQIQFLQKVLIQTQSTFIQKVGEKFEAQLYGNNFQNKVTVRDHITNPNRTQYTQPSDKSFSVSQFNGQQYNNNNIQIQQLKKEIQFLNQSIIKNDQQFSVQIQKYNSTLYDMQNQIINYQRQLQKMNYLQQSLYQNRNIIDKMKQQKYRDDIIIQNMTKKLRYYQKSRGTGIFRQPQGKQRFRLNTMNDSNMYYNLNSYNSMSNLNQLNNNHMINRASLPIDIQTQIQNLKNGLNNWKNYQKYQRQKNNNMNFVKVGLKNSGSQPRLDAYKQSSIINSDTNMNSNMNLNLNSNVNQNGNTQRNTKNIDNPGFTLGSFNQ